MITIYNSNLDFDLDSSNSITLSSMSNMVFKTNGSDKLTIQNNGISVSGNVVVSGLITSTGAGFSGIGAGLSNIPISAINELRLELNGGTTELSVTRDTLNASIVSEARFGSNYTGRINSELNTRVDNTSNYVFATSNILIGRIINTSNYVDSTSNFLSVRIDNTSNYALATSNILIGRIINTSNYVDSTSNFLGGRIDNTSNYALATSNILIGRIINTSNYVDSTSNFLGGRIDNTSNYALATSNILIGRIINTCNYVESTSNTLIGRIINASNYVESTSNTLIGRIINASNYVESTSNTLIGRIINASNYVDSTSNFLSGRIDNTSNYALATSNILIGRIINTSNYVESTSNILIGRIINTSNYVESTSNTLIGRIINTSNYVDSTSNFLARRIDNASSWGSNYTDKADIWGSNYSDKVGGWGSNYAYDKVGVWGSNYAYDKVGVWGSNYSDKVGVWGSNYAYDKVGVWSSNYSDRVGVWGSNYAYDKVGVWSSNYSDRVGVWGSNYAYDKVGVWGSNYTDRIGERTSNYVLSTSNILIGRVIHTSNYVSTYKPATAVTADFANRFTNSVNIAGVPFNGTANISISYNALDNQLSFGNGLSTSYDNITKITSVTANAAPQEQSDWTQTSTSSASFIKNKPTIPSNTFQLNGSIAFYNSGNVGIGTNAPLSLLEIITANYTGALLTLDAGVINSTTQMPRSIGRPLLKLGKTSYSTSAGDYYGIGFGISPTLSDYNCAEIGTIITSTEGLETGDIIFSTRPGTNNVIATERMRITSAGNVGIGTNTGINNIFQVGSGGRLRIANNTYDWSMIGTNDTNGTTNTRIVISGTDRGVFNGNIEYVTTSTGSHMFLSDGATERMRIANNGNVGIGTTDTATYKLNVAGDINISSGSSFRVGGATLSTFTPSSTNLIGSFLNTQFENVSSAIQIKSTWKPTTAGTADTANALASGSSISANTITTTGNVGIGTTDPASKLHMYNDTDLNTNIIVQNNMPIQLLADITIVGTTLTTIGNSKCITFPYTGTPSTNANTTYTFTTTAAYTIDILIVGGGGAGGQSMGAGGGAGGVVYATNLILPIGTYSVRVGRGGIGPSSTADPAVYGTNQDGVESSLMNSDGTSYISLSLGGTLREMRGFGGGGGGTYYDNINGRNGGSGGGSSENNPDYALSTPGTATQPATYWNGSSYVVGGTSGRQNTTTTQDYQAGGGGGLGGQSADYRNGNAGVAISITGTSQFYAAGGGAGQYIGASTAAGIGGSSIGGNGRIWLGSAYAAAPRDIATSGANGTGSGGGGGAYVQAPVSLAGSGGSGIVIIRYSNITSSSSINLVRGSVGDNNIDYKLGNYGGEFKITRSINNADTNVLTLDTSGKLNVAGDVNISAGSQFKIDGNVLSTFTPSSTNLIGSFLNTQFENVSSAIQIKSTWKPTTAGTADAVPYSGITSIPATWADSQIPSLATSKITSGTFADSFIPSLAISKTSGLQTALDAKQATLTSSSTLSISAITTAGNVSIGYGKSINDNNLGYRLIFGYPGTTDSNNQDTNSTIIRGYGNVSIRFQNAGGNEIGSITNGGLFTSTSGGYSDIRIKKEILDINDDSALQMILAIEPKTYKYIDDEIEVARVYGFIGQQLRSVIPEATEIQIGLLPNIMKNAVCDKNKVYLDLTGYTDVPLNDDTRRVNINYNNRGDNYKIIEVNKDYFVIDKELYYETIDNGNPIKTPLTNVFVRGYEVNDFHKIKKDYVFTLNVCATQELHRLISAQQIIIKSYEERIKELERKMEIVLNNAS